MNALIRLTLAGPGTAGSTHMVHLAVMHIESVTEGSTGTIVNMRSGKLHLVQESVNDVVAYIDAFWREGQE